MTSRETRIGKYQILAELGRGGMSRVYLAAVAGPGGFNKLVVLKVLLNELTTEDPSFVDMFLDEAKLAARLNHPRIVQTNEVGSEDDRYFIAMEYLDGQALHRIVRRATKEGSALPTPVFLSVLADALEGLHAAHTAKDFDGKPLLVVHRDASPQNIFVTYDGQVKVMDFGIAKAAGRGSEATRLGVLKGKVVYMAPEQVEDAARVDHRADIFAIGIILYDFLASRRMWQGLSEVEVVSRLVRREYQSSPMVSNAGVHPALDAICKRALQPDPTDRYPDARAMCDEIRAHLLLQRTLPTDREIGALVSSLFAREREQIATVIEHQLQSINDETEAPLPRLQSIGTETLTPASLTAPRAPVAHGQKRTGAVVAALAVVATGILVWLVPRSPAAAITPTSIDVPRPQPSAVPPPVAVPVSPPPASVEPAPPPDTTPSATTKPRVGVAVPFVPTFTAPRPVPRTVLPPATTARPVATEPPAPTPPRSTKPDLGY